jgi:2-hydroxychromene-2-carboxylate isomerase
VQGERFAELKSITQPTLVVNGNSDIMIPTVNSYTLSQHIPIRGTRRIFSIPACFSHMHVCSWMVDSNPQRSVEQINGRSKVEPVRVEFLFDFGSPNAYLAEKVIPEIERRASAKFEYVPVLLGGIYKLTNNRSPGESLAGIKNKPEFMELEIDRFIRRHNITTFHKNPFFPVNTLQLMRGAVAARFEGVFEPYFRAAYHHMWEEPKKMDDPQVAREAFLSSNIEFDLLFARAQQPDVKNRLLELTQSAVDRGAFGSPTFFVGKQMFFGKDQLRDVEEAIIAAGMPAAKQRQQARA